MNINYEILKSFHYTTMLPVGVYKDGVCLTSYPEKLTFLNSISDKLYTTKDILESSGKNPVLNKAFYYENNYFECFICLPIDENTMICAGPAIREKMTDGSITSLIRTEKLPLKLKTKLTSYYDSLIVIDYNRYFHIGKLLEHVFSINYGDSLNHGDTSSAFVSEKYFAEMTKNRELLFHHPPYFLEQELLGCIKAGNQQEAHSVLARINSLRRPRLSKDSLRSVKNSLICSTTLFTRAAIEGGVQPEAAFTLSDSVILAIESISDIDTLINFEAKALDQYIGIIKDLSKNKYSTAVQKALSFIYKNLTEKLTLKDIAAESYVHPNYLSSLFKKEVGMSIPDYIMKTRVNEAKYYIRYTDTSISEIASFYQFCNQSYFISAFKKFSGVTPNVYRMKYNQQNE